MSTSILVVDDSSMVRQQVSKALAAAGFSVTEAHDGVDALNKLLTSPSVSLIILDVNMPNMNGIELLKQLKDKPELAKVPVVMLTTEGQPKLMQEAKSLGAKGWIIKPFNPEMLIAAVKKLTTPRA